MFERVILHVTEGALKGQTFVLENENTYILGRSWDCSHRFPDAFNMVSRHHCRIRVSAPLIYIQDLGSLNGTYVNDANIGQRGKELSFEEALQQEHAEHPLWHGDEVRIGCHAFQIENGLHWQLDVTFREDDSRIQARNGAANFALLRKLALTLLKRHPAKESIACKRLHAALDVEFLHEVIQQSGNF